MPTEVTEQTGNQPQEATSSEPVAAAQPFWETLDQEQPEQTPEPAGQTEEEQPQTVEGEEAEPQTVEEEDADNWLPSEQEKVFPPDVIAKYAKRYGYTEEEAADPRIARLLHDKINSDIYVQQLANQQPEEEESEEPTQEPQKTDAETPQPPTPEQRAQWLEQVVTQGVDQKSVESFGREFLTAAGVDPKDPANEAILANAPAVGKALAKGAIDLFTTLLPQFLPELLPQIIEQQYPKFGDMHGRSLYQMAYESVRASKPEFSSMPRFGPELETVLLKAQESIPNFEQIANRITGTPFEKATTLYELLLNHAAGQKVTPQEVKAAIDTTRRQVKDAERNRAAGQMLGAGQSTKKFAPANDPRTEFRSMIDEYNASQRSTPSKGQ